MLQHREDFHAKRVKDEDVLDKDATAAAFPFDHCDMDPIMSVLPGEGPHLANIACTSSTVRGKDLRLQDATRLRRRGDLNLDVLMKGPNAEAGEERLQLFQTILRRASFNAVIRRSSGPGPASCVEVELRKVRIRLNHFELEKLVLCSGWV